jgi:hypothetical protein
MALVCFAQAATGSPNWTAAVEAVATSLSALVLFVGAIVAQRYLRRADGSVDAIAFSRPGGLVLHVRPCVRSAGLVRVRLDRRPDAEPQVIVSEVRLDNGSEVRGQAQSKRCLKADTAIDPGESVTGSEIFLVPLADPDLVGWHVEFLFAFQPWLPRLPPQFRKKFFWYWLRTDPRPPPWEWDAETFVPVPPSEPRRPLRAARRV